MRSIKDVRRRVLIYLGIAVSIIGVVGIAYAAFSDRGDVAGTTVTVGSADIKLLDDLGGNLDETNLLDVKDGPNFQNIGQNWQGDYFVQLFNNGSSAVSLFTTADYETVNDPEDLRQEVNVEIFPWDDINLDGTETPDEIGTSLGKKTIVKWKTEGFDLGTMETGEIKGYLIRFSTENLSDSFQGASMLFDFGFDSVAFE